MFKVIQSVRVHQLFNASINRLKVRQSVVEYSLFKQKKFFLADYLVAVICYEL